MLLILKVLALSNAENSLKAIMSGTVGRVNPPSIGKTSRLDTESPSWADLEHGDLAQTQEEVNSWMSSSQALPTKWRFTPPCSLTV